MRNIQMQRGIGIGIEIGNVGKKTSSLASLWGGTDAMETKSYMAGLGGGRGVRGGASASALAFGMERMMYDP